jgi:CDP-glycerol glycerophosphotransferase
VQISQMRRLPGKIAAALRYEVIARARRAAVRPDTVLYESFAGAGMLDNPEAIFDQLRTAPDFGHLTHVWVIADDGLRRTLEQEWHHEPAVRFVPRAGWRYWRALASAGFLVNNATFPPEFAKRSGQIYLNTWHGTPLKHMGYDMPDGPRESANTLRNFVQADWLLSQNRFMTETMYRGAYRLDGVFDGEVIEEGYPRTDRQHLDAAGYAAARAQLAARGLEIGDRPILLYAPTWKGARFSEVLDDVAELVATVRRLQDRVGSRYVVLLKTHQSVYGLARRDPLIRRMLVPGDIPTNTLLGITELLVTDYSSIQFDYLGSRRPIVYYVPDLDRYAGYRGRYLTPDSWPGPVARTTEELCDAVGRFSPSRRDEWAPAREEWASRYTAGDDGGASERVVDVVFRGRRAGRRTLRLTGGARTRLLFYIGGLRSNGITSAAVALVNALAERDDLDVSVIYGRPRAGNSRDNAAQLSPSVRQFLRQGGMNATRLDHRRRRSVQPDAAHLWRDEWDRIFGSARFDTVVDFSGYSPFWAQLLLASPPARRLVWLHNDLALDAERTVAGRAPLRAALHAVFALYRRFDALVSVSAELDRINRRSLAGHAPQGSFTWVPNLVDAVTVRAQAAVPLEQIGSDALTADRPALAYAARRLATTPESHWLATVGRLSPEKNQARLIRAFARVHEEHRDARLLIVGDGPLREQLEALVARESLGGAVVFAGATPNPAALLAHAGCFVLSSDYEGMPMVLLEAATLGMPIITTRFGSVAAALPDVSLRVAERDDDALAEAMSDYLRGGVAPVSFDAERHNSEALSQARAVLLGTRRAGA